ncbi:MAG: WG repeat-containing protein [Oscillospiraceae bacterium]|nr:WG repeat-containing protein [Oscillospiraceae bacterium]
MQAADTAIPTIEILTDAIYDDTGYFSEGLAWVRTGDDYQYIDESGNVAIGKDKIKALIDKAIQNEKDLAVEYDYQLSDIELQSFGVDSCGDFYEGIAYVRITNNYDYPVLTTFYINKNGNVLFEFRYGIGYNFVNGFAVVFRFFPGFSPSAAMFYIIDKSGNKIFDYNYTEIMSRSEIGTIYPQFHENLFAVEQIDYDAPWDYNNAPWEDRPSIAGYINEKGDFVIPMTFEATRPFNQGLAFAKQNGKWGFIDKSGKFVIQPEYDDVMTHDISCTVFDDGLALVKKDGKWGYIDKTGNIVIPFIYDYDDDYHDDGTVSAIANRDENNRPSLFSNGLAEIKQNGKWGYINKAGNLVIPFIYDDANLNYDGALLVGNDGVYKLIDEKGNDFSSETWDFDATASSVDSFNATGIFTYSRNGTYGFAKISFAAAPEPVALTATPTAATVLVNGDEVAFDAYNIEGSNYFKLRDLAFVLSDTQKQFEVGWDEANNAISLTSGKPYTTSGGELAISESKASKTATPTSSKIYLDGKEVEFTAYNIDGNNYFKLRDVMQTFDVYVGWDGATSTITLDTSMGYVQ